MAAARGLAAPTPDEINKWLSEASVKFHDHPAKDLKSPTDVARWFVDCLPMNNGFALFAGEIRRRNPVDL